MKTWTLRKPLSLNTQRKSGSVEVKCKTVRNGPRLLHSSADVWCCTLLILIQANTSQSIAHLSALNPLAWFPEVVQICGFSLKQRRGPRRDGAAAFHSFFFIFIIISFTWRLHSSSFHSFVHALTLAPALTATAAADLDGFDLLWLEHTFILSSHSEHTHTPPPHTSAPIGQAKSKAGWTFTCILTSYQQVVQFSSCEWTSAPPAGQTV